MSASDASSSPASEIKVSAPLCAIFRRFLKQQGLKFTHERAVILDAVLARKTVFEVDELLDEMRDQGQRASKATVYRTIKHLVEAGIIEEVLLDSRQAHYRLAYGREHADHLIDVDSDRIIEVQSPELAAIRDEICRAHGLDPVGHRMIIYGTKPGRADADKGG
jgi:Fur family ferric uptake transcriptional regulator